MERLNVAFVGCGHIALEYVNVYCSLPFVRLARCVDIDAAFAEQMAARCFAANGEKPEVSTEFADALRDDIDVVVINTPNDLHCPQALAAFAAGKHVLLQKPLAANLADSEKIAEAALRAKGTVGMYMSYLDQPLLHDLRDMVAANMYGDVVEFYGRSMHPKGMLWSKQAALGQHSWRNSVLRTGGGCFIQLAVHYIRLAQWILDTTIVEVQASMANLHSPGLEGEDVGSASMRTASGARIMLSTAWCASGDQLSITGTAGASDYLYNRLLHVKAADGFKFEGRTVRLGGSADSSTYTEVVAPEFGAVENPLNQHRRFLEAVRDGKTVDVTVDQALEDMRVLTACYESARMGVPVLVDSLRHELVLPR